MGGGNKAKLEDERMMEIKVEKEKATKEKNNPSWLLIFVPVFIKS